MFGIDGGRNIGKYAPTSDELISKVLILASLISAELISNMLVH